ncbi:MAG: 1-(5-phosphoribosyl)-5-[(5-phosphoribosylamino)methylideneamino]imidazole-4-carboxamide isomerase [Alphaproteobacteria bacterium]|nr:1-(5-phosphoribosyl)-5-[(5-phosphoribosylamino)methylideneamino]imidazole-4-carboxamide isomerase [Alphaproteobacteria bacterium]
MIIFPAIDLKAGQCVRLKQGDMQRATLFNGDPSAQAEIFIKQGFSHLHVIDLDGAFAGASVNGKAIEDILAVTKKANMEVQLGGGIRDLQAIENWLDKGIHSVIVGTIAARDPNFVKNACKLFPKQIKIAIDARDGQVAVAGWAEESNLSALELAKHFEGAGAAALIYTDIARDGILKGVNVEATKKLAKTLSTPIIASGGLASIEDIIKLQAVEKYGIKGVIAGRALYEKQIKADEVLNIEGVC